jgi:predicted RNase H-like nuclease
MINTSNVTVPRQSVAYLGHGAVLGIDVGWSRRKPTSGLCLIEWTNGVISQRSCEAAFDEDDRREKLDGVTQRSKLLAVGIDGPLSSGLAINHQYRSAEALLSRGRFQQRGKPGPTNSKSGQSLHIEATRWARLVLDTQDVSAGTYPYKIHEKAIVEAFPNAFLAVLHPDEGFPTTAEANRHWTDTLFPLVTEKLWKLIETLLPHRRLSFHHGEIHGHEGIASFLCALTSLCTVSAKCIVVGDTTLGYIVLPPLELWGASAGGGTKWAEETLHDNYISVRHLFSSLRFYKDDKLCMP